ncbi:Dormancy-associated protein 1 [Castilleja foliolosa]|uniref:Dormancy-associated protein 1 n=1 Tax=Castilleja foliolosa TaxID=1961234 RepID=A0ABD3DMD7_9LAMI
MVLLDHLWDDVVAGPQPTRGLKHLKKMYSSKPLNVNDLGGEGSSGGKFRSLSMPTSPTTPPTPGTPSPTAGRRDNVWRSVFNPGSNLATKGIGSNYFDKPQPNTPTVYDCCTVGKLGASTVEVTGARLHVNSVPPLLTQYVESLRDLQFQ